MLKDPARRNALATMIAMALPWGSARADAEELFHALARVFGAAAGALHVPCVLSGLPETLRVPAREQDAVRDHANFYFDQQDLVAERAARAGFGWTVFRPQIVLGVATGSAMNPVAAIGAYAVLARERGQPLACPAHPHLLTECTDARLIAKAIEWAWHEPRAHGEAFNIANGDVVVWASLFERLAAFFDMPLGEATGTRLREEMPAQAALWQRIAQREGLREGDLDALIGLSWQYAEATWAARRPLALPPLVSTVKLRQAGFGDCIDTEQCIVEHLQAMRDLRYLP
jgi:hypothetical protein